MQRRDLLIIGSSVLLASCAGDRSAILFDRTDGQRPRLADRVQHEPAPAFAAPPARPDASITVNDASGSVSGLLPDQARVSGPLQVHEDPALVLDQQSANHGEPATSEPLMKHQLSQGIDANTIAPASPEGGGTNGWAIAGFVSSFFIPILGIIFSAIGLGQIKRTGQKGRGLAIAGIVISILSILIYIAVLA